MNSSHKDVLKDRSPGNGALAVGVGAGGGVVGEQREANGFGGAFGNGLCATMVVSVGCGVTGICGVDLDSRIAKQICELHGEHVERSLGGAVANQLGGGGRVSGVSVLGKRAEPAEDIHDTRSRRRVQQRKHSLRDCQSTKEVRAQDPFDGLKPSSRSRAVARIVDAGIVDEDVARSAVRFRIRSLCSLP